jgi:hypothetical protein
MKFTVLFSSLFFFYNIAFGQATLSGKITDEQHNPVPFASVYIKSTTKGTSANSEGEYTLQLPAGSYQVQFRAVGYKSEELSITLAGNKTVNVVLQAQSFQLKDVTVNAGGEDPAYAIIRKTIKRRKSHLNEVDAYTCDVYIKGLQKLLAAPKKFMGFDIQKAARENGLDSNRRGIVYLSESQSKYSFEKPDNVHEEMISSKVSGSNRAFSYNRASDIKVNFYENSQNWGGLSNRPIISPIADNALFYYKYKYIGFSTENGQTVDKIQVIPRRAYDACLQGYIYIVEDDWRLYGLELFITKKQNINFVDTLRVGTQFMQVNQKVWMPSTIRFEFTGGIFGFKLGGYFISMFSDYDLKPKFNKKEFAEVLRIDKSSNKKDSTYWENERPVPLTAEEKTDYQKKAVLARKRESKPYLDSLDSVNNKFHPGSFLLGGYRHSDRYNHEYYFLDPLLTSFRFNTVQGVALNYGAVFRKRIDTNERRGLEADAKVGYGFGDRIATGAAGLSLPIAGFGFHFGAGSEVTDLNNTEPVSPLVNSLYSLFERENYQKLYQKQYLTLSVYRRIAGGLQATAGLEWADRRSLPNTSEYSFFDPNGHQYTSNNPLASNSNAPLFPDNQSLKFNFRATYDFSNKYETFPYGRHYIPSPYPTIGINYEQGINGVLGSDVNYSLLSTDISKTNVPAGIFGNTSFYIGAGKFLNNSNMFYPDFKQFAGNEVFFFKSGIDSFLLLNYYTYSTNTEYVEGHIEQNFSGFILNKIPLIRKLKLQEIVDVNYLSTPQLKNYTELGVGIQYLTFRIMYGTSFNSGGNIKSAVRLGLSF